MNRSCSVKHDDATLIALTTYVSRQFVWSQVYEYSADETVFNPVWTPVDITNYAFILMVKKDLCDDDSLALIHATSVNNDPVHGVFTFTVLAAQMNIEPGTYPFDVSYRISNGDPQELESGFITILGVVNYAGN